MQNLMTHLWRRPYGHSVALCASASPPTRDDLQAAQQLRFQVFNELNEGLSSAYIRA
jgi:hypothetical protein